MAVENSETVTVLTSVACYVLKAPLGYGVLPGTPQAVEGVESAGIKGVPWALHARRSHDDYHHQEL